MSPKDDSDNIADDFTKYANDECPKAMEVQSMLILQPSPSTRSHQRLNGTPNQCQPCKSGRTKTSSSPMVNARGSMSVFPTSQEE